MQTLQILMLCTIFFYCIVLPGIFQKAGINKALGYIPLFNLFVWTKVFKKPWWWTLILIVPGVNIIMLISMNVTTARVFGIHDPMGILLSIYAPFYLLPKIAFSKSINYVGLMDWSNTQLREKRKISDHILLLNTSFGLGHAVMYVFKIIFGQKEQENKPSQVYEWYSALVFAVIAASIIRGYALEAFTIPTSSMEKTLLKGDFLFVSKFHYGTKIPNTPLSFPFAHHTIPNSIMGIPLPLPDHMRSYLTWIKLPYYRLPGFQEIKRNDMVVFNFPEGDTVIVDNQNRSYYQVMREDAYMLHSRLGGQKTMQECREIVRQNYINKEKLTVRPVDKKENYIKRCVGMPGDVLKIQDAVLYINEKPAMKPEEMQFRYMLMSDALLNKKTMKKQWDINPEDMMYDSNGDMYYIVTSPVKAEKLKTETGIKNISMLIAQEQDAKDPTNSVFPNNNNYPWTQDNFGPILIPKAGLSIPINMESFPIYQRIIEVYEDNKVQIDGSKILINGKECSEYTFKMNYYWLMGDNRHNSLDSRFWGFVPEDHVVGKAVFIWMSLDPDLGWSEGKIRWKRFFNVVHKD